jgi:taurine dioxygenase
MIDVQPSGAACGASITGVDLREPLAPEVVAQIRQAWLAHQVIAFPGQSMGIADLERFTLALGDYGEDPYILPTAGHPHVIEVRREADEKAPIFAETWHSDWSFLKVPPAGTALYGTIVPPVGGDTLFANQYLAWEALPGSMKHRLEGLRAIHSARRGYSRQGMYGENDRGRSMTIRFGDSAMATQLHPIARAHPETGRKALFVSPGYTIGIEGLPAHESDAILRELFQHQARPEFVYRHRWSAGMLTIWDNRCVVHAATGGYEGHRRLLHRITIAERIDECRLT